MNTSIVIPLAGPGHGSRWNDTELRYCLRSIVKHLSGYGDIFLIGHKPDWVKNIIHIPATDGEKTYEKERNVFGKLTIAAGDIRITDDFLRMDDDHFLLSSYIADKFPFYYEGWLKDELSISDYKHTLNNTVKEIGDKRYFDVHCPMIFNKQRIWTTSALHDWNVKFGYCVKTTYCADHYLSGSPVADLKIRDPFPADQIREMIAGRSWFSIGHKACTTGMLTILSELYPSKSPYEK